MSDVLGTLSDPGTSLPPPAAGPLPGARRMQGGATPGGDRCFGNRGTPGVAAGGSGRRRRRHGVAVVARHACPRDFDAWRHDHPGGPTQRGARGVPAADPSHPHGTHSVAGTAHRLRLARTRAPRARHLPAHDAGRACRADHRRAHPARPHGDRARGGHGRAYLPRRADGDRGAGPAGPRRRAERARGPAAAGLRDLEVHARLRLSGGGTGVRHQTACGADLRDPPRGSPGPPRTCWWRPA